MSLSLKKIFTTGLAAVVLAVAVVAAPVATTSVYAEDSPCATDPTKSGSIKAGIDCAKGTSTDVSLFGSGSIFNTIVNILLFLIGGLSVIMLIWGGIRYTTSGGNSSSVTAAKNTIMYAIIGLIVAFLAFAIVNWVLTTVTPTA